MTFSVPAIRPTRKRISEVVMASGMLGVAFLIIVDVERAMTRVLYLLQNSEKSRFKSEL